MKDRTKKGSSIADKIIKKMIPAAIESRKVVGHEIKYSLPADQASKLPALFAELEAEIARDGDSSLKTYGVSMTTLEDVFFKVSNELAPLVVEKSESDNTINTEDNNRKEEEERHNLVKDYSDVQRRSGSIFCSMFMLRLRRVVRSPGTILIPAVVTLALFTPMTSLVNLFDVPKDEFLILSNPAGKIYFRVARKFMGNQLCAWRVAVNEPSTSDFSKFLTENNIIASSYSGKFEDLLNLNKEGESSMAAVTITSQTFSATDHELVAEMRINGTFRHAPGIMLALISKYFNRMSQTNPASGSELFTNLKYYPLSDHDITHRPTNNGKSYDLNDFVFLFMVVYLCQLLNVGFLGMVNEIIKDKEVLAVRFNTNTGFICVHMTSHLTCPKRFSISDSALNIQHDALWENITLKEHLLLYATIRGIPKNKQNKLVAHFLEGLNIAEHVNKRASRLSGGTKRKLSYAMSMLGAPRIVLLDEPSTGMDPQSKRFLWNTVLATFKDSRGAMLTTHSMEEADVLCNRIAIMANGTILCIGTPQHLKNKFGTGYNIEIKLKQESHDVDVGSSHSSAKANTTVVEVAKNATKAHSSPQPPKVPVPAGADNVTRLPPAPVPAPMPLRAAGPTQGGQHGETVAPASTEIEVPPEFRFVVERFPNSKLVELFENRAVFSVLKAQNFSLAGIFTTLENWKATGNVEEYSFSQTTLEEIFLMFNKDDKKNS